MNSLYRSAALTVTCMAINLLVGNTGWAQKESVNPGINKSFKDADVTAYVERFEREGREVYTQRQQVVDLSKAKEGMAMADIGAGTGLFTRLFSDAVGDSGRVYAVDISQNFIDHIQKTCDDKDIGNVVGVVCEQDNVKLPPNSIDLAFICDTYHHFEFPVKTMATLHAALRPGGQLIVIDFERIEGVSSDFIMSHVRAGKETFLAEIQKAGFELEGEEKIFKENYFLRFAKADRK